MSESVEIYRGPLRNKPRAGGLWLSRTNDKQFQGMMGAPKPWAPTPIQAPLGKKAKKKRAPARFWGTPPIPSVCRNGCGRTFESRTQEKWRQNLSWLCGRCRLMRHGRAVMPWGKWKGCRIRLLPDSYISWLTSTPILKDPRWHYLKASLLAELKFRGLREDLADIPDPAPVLLPVRPIRKLRE